MRGLDSPPGVWDRQRQRKEKQVKSISHSDFAIPSRGLTTERFSKAGPAPNAESCLNCPMSLVEPLVLSKKGAFWHRFCAQAVSLWTVNGPFLFAKTKRIGGFIPAPQSGALPPSLPRGQASLRKAPGPSSCRPTAHRPAPIGRVGPGVPCPHGHPFTSLLKRRTHHGSQFKRPEFSDSGGFYPR